MDKEIRNQNNIIIGWCKDRGNQIDAVHIRKGFIGHYSKNSNITFDKSGKIYCYGDGTSDLVRQVEREG